VLNHPPRVAFVGDIGLDERRLATGRPDQADRLCAGLLADSATTTLAPSAANISAAVRPIPLPAPVMIETLSWSRIVFLGPVRWLAALVRAAGAPGPSPYRGWYARPVRRDRPIRHASWR